MSEQPPSGPPPYQPPYQPPPPPPGWSQPAPPPPPGWAPGPPMGPPMGYPYGPPPPQPRKPRRARLVLAVLAAVVVIAAAIVVPLVVLGGDDGDRDRDEAGPSEPVTSTTSEESEPVAATLDDVVEYDGLEPDHVPLGDPVDYPESPPVGGNHWSEWLECGAYPEPVANENAVHDLEHGAVWITYDPSLPADDVAALEAQLPQNGIMSPYPDLPAPVVITVWGRQLALTGADDPRIPLFVDEYDDGVTAPEPFASCAGGTASGPPIA